MSYYEGLDAADLLDNVVVGVHQVLETEGVLGLRLRQVASRGRMSPASLNQHFGPWHRVLQRVAWRTGHLRWQGLACRLPVYGLAGLLPESTQDLQFLRSWLGMVEIGRSIELVASALVKVERDRGWTYAAMIRSAHDGPPVRRGRWRCCASSRACSASPASPSPGGSHLNFTNVRKVADRPAGGGAQR